MQNGSSRKEELLYAWHTASLEFSLHLLHILCHNPGSLLGNNITKQGINATKLLLLSFTGQNLFNLY